MIKNSLTHMEGWLYLVCIALLLAVLTGPGLQSLIEDQRRIKDTEALIDSHITALSAPAPTDAFLSHQTFIHMDTSGKSAAMNANQIQAALIDIVKLNKARLVEMRTLAVDKSIDTMQAQVFRLEYEGDLQAILATLEALGRMKQPVLINDFTLKPVGQYDRSDRRMRATLKLSFWTESSNS